VVTKILTNVNKHVISTMKLCVNHLAPSVMKLLILINYRSAKWIQNCVLCWSLGSRREM